MRTEPDSLLTSRRSIAGSMSDGIPETRETISVCAEHGIGAQVAVSEAGYIDEASDRFGNDGRYRFVIDASTVASE